jgi:hypothetical protein
MFDLWFLIILSYVKFILQSVVNYKRGIYALKREQRLIELFLEKQYFLCGIATYFIRSSHIRRTKICGRRLVVCHYSYHSME